MADLTKIDIMDKMNIPIVMRTIYNVKHRYAIILKFWDKFLTSPKKVGIEAKPIIFSTRKENVPLYYRIFWAFAFVIIILKIS